MDRTSRTRGRIRVRRLLVGIAASTLASGAFALSTGLSSAGENCLGLNAALRANLDFIAAQQANPDALSAARIANRQAVIDLIDERRAAAGCTGDAPAGGGRTP